MSATFECGDPGALVAYLYDECAPGERETIAAHLLLCAACAAEVIGLTSTRQAIAAWTPPAIELGIQITRKDADDIAQTASLLAFRRPQDPVPATSQPWWRAPLPAWAQAAAALMIFAAGLSVGFMRDGSREQPARATVSPGATPVAMPSKDDLTQLEQRLRTEMVKMTRSNAPAVTATPVVARSNDDAVLQRVQELIAQSEERQRVEFTERTVRQASAFEAQRRADLETVRTSLGQFQGTTSAEVRQQRQAIDEINRYLVQVSQKR